MASKLCDSCKSAAATLFCRPDSAFLCFNCDSKIHSANKLASHHPRVFVCQVCEQAPAHVTCKADAAALCLTCDRDIHSANPLSRRHERVPVTPFYGSANHHRPNAVNFLDNRYFSDVDGDAADVSREEAEAASWLLPNPPNSKLIENSDLDTGQYVFSDVDPYMDDDCDPVDRKIESREQNSSGADGVVPVQNNKTAEDPLINDNCFEFEFIGSKPFSHGYSTNCLSNSVSSSSLDVGVVPDGGEISNPYIVSGMESTNQTVMRPSGVDREARVIRYREKRKNRKFEKTIRYASRKAYAETRPRIKGRFAKRTDIEGSNRTGSSDSSIYGFGVVPSF